MPGELKKTERNGRVGEIELNEVKSGWKSGRRGGEQTTVCVLFS